MFSPTLRLEFKAYTDPLDMQRKMARSVGYTLLEDAPRNKEGKFFILYGTYKGQRVNCYPEWMARKIAEQTGQKFDFISWLMKQKLKQEKT